MRDLRPPPEPSSTRHPELIAFRRHLHAHPEPLEERETTALVAQRLERRRPGAPAS